MGHRDDKELQQQQQHQQQQQQQQQQKQQQQQQIQASEQQLQEAVSSAGRWLQDWHLLVNVEKTVTMLFHHDNRPPERLPTIYLQDHLLNVARKQRHLGIVFQHDLRWAEHINTILNKSLTSLKNLLRLRNSLNSSALSYLYRTYIRPKLEYACIALSPLPINTLDRLERFQRKAARIMPSPTALHPCQ